MSDSYKAPLVTTPHSKYNRNNYNADLIREKAKDRWFDIWDALGVPLSFQQNSACPICGKLNVFQIENEQIGMFHCAGCEIRGDGIGLIQLYHDWNFSDSLERVARILKLRPREVHL